MDKIFFNKKLINNDSNIEDFLTSRLENSTLNKEYLNDMLRKVLNHKLVKKFPDEEMDIEWAGSVLDLLEFIGFEVI